MYYLKEEKKDEIILYFKKINKTRQEIADTIGITLNYLNIILGRLRPCSKSIAYCITKVSDREKEIDYFFEREK